jgi:hypothetical protein
MTVFYYVLAGICTRVPIESTKLKEGFDPLPGAKKGRGEAEDLFCSAIGTDETSSHT